MTIADADYEGWDWEWSTCEECGGETYRIPGSGGRGIWSHSSDQDVWKYHMTDEQRRTEGE